MNKHIKFSLLFILSLSMGCNFFSLDDEKLRNKPIKRDFYSVSSYIRDNDIESITKYLEDGGDANLDDSYSCLLSVAAEHINLPIAKLLLEHGANASGTPSLLYASYTPLSKAVKDSYKDPTYAMATLLLENGAAPEFKGEGGSNTFSRPLCKALELDPSDNLDALVFLLIKKGAKLEKKCTYDFRNNLNLILEKQLVKSTIEAVAASAFGPSEILGAFDREIFYKKYPSVDTVAFMKKMLTALPPQFYDSAGSLLIRVIMLKNSEIAKSFEPFKHVSGFFDKPYIYDLSSGQKLSPAQIIAALKGLSGTTTYDRVRLEEIEQILVGFGMGESIDDENIDDEKSDSNIPIEFGKKPANWYTNLDPVLASDLSIWKDPKIKKIAWWKNISNNSNTVRYYCQKIFKYYVKSYDPKIKNIDSNTMKKYKSEFFHTYKDFHTDKFESHNKRYSEGAAESDADQESRFLYKMIESRWKAALSCFD